MTITIYRVQDASGRGPWRPGFSDQWVEARPDHGNLPPCYIEFGLVSEKALPWEYVGCGCGCRTLEQLRRWITASEYHTLLRHGYQAVAVKADRILGESSIQCVFATREPLKICTPVELYPITDAKEASNDPAK